MPKSGTLGFVYLPFAFFGLIRYPSPEIRHLSPVQQRQQAKSLTNWPSRPISFDRHVYFIDFRRFGDLNPIYFSMVREPVDKFVSRYFYSRFNGGFMYDKLKKRNSSWIRGVSREEYTRRDIEDCIFQGDPECSLVQGQKQDLSIVSWE